MIATLIVLAVVLVAYVAIIAAVGLLSASPSTPAHHSTTAHLQALYPFQSPAGLGGSGCYVGQEVLGGSFCYDPWELYRTNKVTNRMAAEEVLGEWAGLLRQRLDEVHREGAD